MSSVDVVVVNWNGALVIEECLSALVLSAERCDHDVTLVVVDNGSRDDSLDRVRRVAPGAVVVRAEQNLGFAGGAHLGIQRSHAEVVVLVNNDAVVDPDFLQIVVDALLTAPASVAAVTGHLLLAGTQDESGVPLVNSTGNEVTRSGNGRDRDYLSRDDGPPALPDVFGFCGGAAALRRSALETAGDFDASLFLYYEDTELSWRLRRRGFTVRYERRAVVVHRHAFSSGTGSDVFAYHNTRNRLLVATRHAPLEVVLLAWASALVRAARTFGPARHRPGRAVLRGTLAAVRLLPRELRRRRREDKASVVRGAELRALVSRS